MKAILILALAVLGGGLLTGCEHEHHHRRDGYYGRPPAYEYGTGPRYERDWDHH